MPAAHFSREIFRFLGDLKRHNDRDWFAANKERYETHVKDAALSFIEDFAPHLAKIAPAFLAEPRASGGSLFRIHRDTRFAKDKSPYKTHVGIQFRHQAGKDAHCPCFYLHLEPKRCFAGAGLWHPEPAQAQAIREAIARNPGGWRKAAHRRPFAGPYELTGDSLKRPPRGFDAEHPHVEDLKRKDFIGVAELTEGDVTGAGFLREFAKLTAASVPFVGFLCGALEVEV